MPLTLTEVRDVSFSTPPVGEPGYHPDEVDDLLDRVGAEVTRLMEENNELRRQVAQLDAQLRNAPLDPGHNPESPPSLAPLMPPLRPPTSEVGARDADHDMQAAKLRGFEHRYRIQLATHLQSLLHELDGPELATSEDPTRAEQDLVSFEVADRSQTDQSAPEQSNGYGRNAGK